MKKNYRRQSFILAFTVTIMLVCANIISAQASSNTSKHTQSTSDYAFLALPSGTVWKMSNEEGFYTYEEAQKKFGAKLPTKKQWQELIDCCSWTWTGNGYKVTDKKGTSIYFPANGYKSSFGNLFCKDENAFYWASTPNDTTSTDSSGLWIGRKKVVKDKGLVEFVDNIILYNSKKDYHQSVRLVR